MAITHELKTASTAAGTVVLALVVFWFTRGVDMPTRVEVGSMIAKESPYLRDQQFIMSKLADSSRFNETTTTLLADLRVELEKLRITLDNMNKQLDDNRRERFINNNTNKGEK